MAAPAILLFDLDGTLVDSALAIAAALSRLSQSRGGGPVAPETVRPLVSQGVDVLVREALGPLARERVEDVGTFREMLEEIPTPPGAIYPGVVDALDRLADAGHRHAVVTNKPERLSELLLEELGLARYFGAIVGGDTLSVCKPDPATLRHALALLGADRDDAIMIGDSFVDAAAARAADMPFVLYEGGYGADDCAPAARAASFAHFADLPDTIAGLARAAAGEVTRK